MEPDAVLALAREHAAAEALGDADRTLATLCPNPVFEFFPSRLTIGGWDNIETFYREQYPRFATKVTGYEVLGEWTNDHTAIQEYQVEIAGDEGPETYRVMSMAPVSPEGKLAGERLYCDEGFIRHLLGPLFGLCQPLD
ncbi:hypothetical protein [Candidatus Poriferisocius sp.]|uniref:hypothetical protein n=1 Tax=Candidatus Poriferisocius sp. TaxID=3101276 RepID=UPI003B5A1417